MYFIDQGRTGFATSPDPFPQHRPLSPSMGGQRGQFRRRPDRAGGTDFNRRSALGPEGLFVASMENNAYPSSLNGVSVFFNGFPVPLPQFRQIGLTCSSLAI